MLLLFAAADINAAATIIRIRLRQTSDRDAATDDEEEGEHGARGCASLSRSANGSSRVRQIESIRATRAST